MPQLSVVDASINPWMKQRSNVSPVRSHPFPLSSVEYAKKMDAIQHRHSVQSLYSLLFPWRLRKLYHSKISFTIVLSTSHGGLISYNVQIRVWCLLNFACVHSSKLALSAFLHRLIEQSTCFILEVTIFFQHFEY